MDDLLIVRMSDRSKERFSRKRRDLNAPIGMNLGLIAGVGLGLVYANNAGASPQVGLGIGIVFGLVFGGLLGRFVKPVRRYKRFKPNYSYEGMPFENEKDESDQEKSPESAN